MNIWENFSLKSLGVKVFKISLSLEQAAVEALLQMKGFLSNLSHKDLVRL